MKQANRIKNHIDLHHSQTLRTKIALQQGIKNHIDLHHSQTYSLCQLDKL